MTYRKTQFTKEELEQQEKDLVRQYIRVKQWMEKDCPELKHKIDKFNHRLFHWMKDHHVNLGCFAKGYYNDWRAQCMPLLVIAGLLTIMNIIVAIITFSGLTLMNIALFAIAFLLYAAAVQIIETSQYNHEGEIDIKQLVNAVPKTPQLKKTIPDISPISSSPQPKPKQKKTYLLSSAIFLLVAGIYLFSPETIRAVLINNYTYPYLPKEALHLLEEFFKMDQAIGFVIFLFAWGLLINILWIPVRIILWIIPKISASRNVREI